jgi:hypothetical protein
MAAGLETDCKRHQAAANVSLNPAGNDAMTPFSGVTTSARRIKYKHQW